MLQRIRQRLQDMRTLRQLFTRAEHHARAQGQPRPGAEHFLLAAIELPDPDDRHVVAAAIHSGAETIITFNLKDFPAGALGRYHLAAQHPDDFIVDLFDLHPASVLQALAEQRASLKKPPKTTEEFLDILRKQGLTQTVSILKDWRTAF